MFFFKFGFLPVLSAAIAVSAISIGLFTSLNPLLIFFIYTIGAYFLNRERFFESLLVFFCISISMNGDGFGFGHVTEDIFSMRIGGVSLFYLIIVIGTPITLLFFKRVNFLIFKLFTIYLLIFIYSLALCVFVVNIVDEIFLFKLKYFTNIILLLAFCAFITKEKAQFIVISLVYSLFLLALVVYFFKLGYFYGGEFFYSMPSTVLLLIFLPFCSFLTVPDRIGVLLLLIFGVSLSLIPFTGKAIIFSVVGIFFACFKLNKSIFVVICVVSFVVVPIYIENIISLLGEFGLHNTAYKLSMIYNVILNQSFIFNNLNTSVGSTLLEIFSSYNWLFHYESFNFFGRGFNGYLTDSNLGIIGLDGFSEFSLRHNMYYSLHMPWLNLILSIGLWTFMMIFVMSFLIESKYLLFVYFLIFAVTPQLSLLVIILIVSDNSTEKVANLRF